jgi:class 3 adenylate cyclase
MKEVGLGIGIDYGDINLVLVGQELAIVGNPVVYACRMAGTRAGNSLLNQPAYENLNERFSKYFSITEDEIEIKHEGTHVAYSVHPNEHPYSPEAPAWRKFAKPPSSEA